MTNTKTWSKPKPGLKWEKVVSCLLLPDDFQCNILTKSVCTDFLHPWYDLYNAFNVMFKQNLIQLFNPVTC